MMLSAPVPAARLVTDSTTGSKASNRRVVKVCNPRTISAGTGNGSKVSCGREPWPPRPFTSTANVVELAVTVPVLVRKVPRGPGPTWAA